MGGVRCLNFILIKMQISERLQQSRGDAWLVLSNFHSGCSIENWLQNHQAQEYVEKPGSQCRHGALVWASVFPFEFWIFFLLSVLIVRSAYLKHKCPLRQIHRSASQEWRSGLQEQRTEGYNLVADSTEWPSGKVYAQLQRSYSRARRCRRDSYLVIRFPIKFICKALLGTPEKLSVSHFCCLDQWVSWRDREAEMHLDSDLSSHLHSCHSHECVTNIQVGVAIE